MHADIAHVHQRLGLLVAQADACLASLAQRERLARRIRTQQRRRGLAAASSLAIASSA